MPTSEQNPAAADVHTGSRRRCSISIVFLIAVTSVLSTTVSLLSGYLLYRESIAALKESIKETSSAELFILEQEVESYVNNTISAVNEVSAIFLHTRRIKGSIGEYYLSDQGETRISVQTDEARRWRKQFEDVAIGYLESAYPSGAFELVVSLITFDKKDPAYLNWHIWWDDTIRADQTPMLISSGYSPDMVNISYNASSPEVPPAVTHNITRRAERIEFMYGWSLDFYWYVKEEDQLADPLFTPYGWKRLNDSTTPASRLFYRWRPPARFARRQYTSFEVIHRPPPPPHPWSSYKAVHFAGMFAFSFWVPIVKTYARENPTKKALLVDPTRNTVYAASDASTNNCKPMYSVQLATKCQLAMKDMTPDIADCYSAAKERWNGRDIFTEARCDGVTHFIRLRMTFRYIPDRDEEGRRLETALLWIQKTSVIKAKVSDALTLFIAFILLVFLVDVLLAVLECTLVAIPLAVLSQLLIRAGRLELDLHSLVQLDKRRLAINEMKSVIRGAIVVTESLQELNSFIPILVTKDEGGESVESSHESQIDVAPLDSVVSWELQLGPRNATLAVVGIASFLQNLGVDTRLKNHSAFVDAMLVLFDTHYGVPDGFLGDRMWGHWNTTKACSPHRTRGCLFSLSVSSWFASWDVVKLQPLMSVVSGDVDCGILGTFSMKSFSVIGSLCSLCFALERLNKTYNTKILVSGPQDEVNHDFIFLLVDQVEYPKISKPFFIYELLEELHMETKEPFWVYNQVVQSYLGGCGDYRENQDMLDSNLLHRFREWVPKHGLGTKALSFL